MKIKTAELEGPALDWAVAKAEGKKVGLVPCDGSSHLVVGKENRKVTPAEQKRYDLFAVQHWKHGWEIGVFRYWEDGHVMLRDLYSPSTDWSQGGPIIEKHIYMLERDNFGMWFARHRQLQLTISGPTPLIAGMRCYIFAGLGNEIEIPGELL